jgi:O-antigen/teichoic acid export membrane protein
MLVALPLAAAVTIMAPLMIQLLGGAAFLPHGYIALQVVIWSIPFGWLNSVTNYVLISLGQERLQTRAFIVGVGFNVIGNLILLPRYSYVGAGLTTIASEIILLFIFNHYLVQKMPDVQWVQLLWRPVAITAIMLGVMLVLAQWHVWLALLVGIVLYPAGLWVLKVFGEEEQRILRSLLPERLAIKLKLA